VLVLIHCGGNQRPPPGLKIIRQARVYGWPAHGTFEPQILHLRGGRCATTDSRWGLPRSRAGSA
jgi:glucose/arabinose dehydrogenase